MESQIALQATVDDRGIFTSYDYGWPGCVHDSRIFKESHLWQHREEYFRAHEYILVDKGTFNLTVQDEELTEDFGLGYPLTPFSIRPFHDHDLTNNAAEARRRKRWNYKLSSMRIFVEHAFGRLKDRFQWLKKIPNRDIDEIYKTVESLLILHNFLESRHDDPTTIEGFHGQRAEDVPGMYEEEEAPPAYVDIDSDQLFRAGLLRRKLLLQLRNEMDLVAQN